jgi:hypothetical protein
MNFLSKIFSTNKERLTSLADSSDNFNQLSIVEMDSVLGGKPLTNPSDEQNKKEKENIVKGF